MESLSERPRRSELSKVIERFSHHSVESLTLGVFLRELNYKGFGVCFMVLSFFCALPVPAVGYGIPFGCCVMFLALQMLVGRKTVWLPTKVLRLPFKQKWVRYLVGPLDKLLVKLERCVHPRWPDLEKVLKVPLALLLFMLGFAMIIPLPMTNTFPALLVFIMGFSISEGDGCVLLISFIIGIATILTYAFLIFLFFLWLAH